MIRELLFLALGWVPLWGAAFFLRREIRLGRVLFGAALVGFVGGMCSVELRRHGLMAALPGSWGLPVLDLHLVEILHFAFLGAAGVIFGEVLLSRLGDSSEGQAEK